MLYLGTLHEGANIGKNFWEWRHPDQINEKNKSKGKCLHYLNVVVLQKENLTLYLHMIFFVLWKTIKRNLAWELQPSLRLKILKKKNTYPSF